MAVRAGILSDTHGVLRPEVLEILEGCDYILHAGDVTDEKLLDRIRYKGKLYVVRGNNDGLWAQNIAKRLSFQIEDVKFFMVHDQRDAGAEAGEADVVVFGHSHRYSEMMVGKTLWLNPGSCGFPRFFNEITMAVMTIDGHQYHVQKIEL